MSKARTLGGIVSTGAVLADGAIDAAEIGNLTLPSGGDIVGTTATQTLTNKTLTAPTIASANLTTALTLAGAAGTNGQVLTSAGSGLPSWTTVSAGLSAATQAQMETATSNTVAATPSNTKYHPGVAKAWVNATVNGVINQSYNVSAVTDVGLGQLGVTIDTDFSNNDYVVFVSGGSSDRFFGTASPAVGSIEARARNVSDVLADPTGWNVVFFGDQS